MDEKAQQKLNPFLSQKETLLWAGQPRPGLALKRQDIRQIPMSIFYCGFSSVWMYVVFTAKVPVFLSIFGGIVVVHALYFLIGRFFYDATKRYHTYYAVTNERVLILCEFMWRDFRTVHLRKLKDVTLQNDEHDVGNIIFGPDLNEKFFDKNLPVLQPDFPVFPLFELIEKASVVYNLILEAQRKLISKNS